MYHKITFDNGLRLITSSMPHAHSVAVIFYIRVGGCYEMDSESGIAHFIEHMCFKGTEKRRTAREISEAIEGTGGMINGGTDKELSIFWCKVASQHFPLAIDVLVDLLRMSRFDAKEIDRERQIIIEEINMSLDSPRQRVGMLIDEILWPGQPLGRDVAGTKETVTAITRQQMLDYFSNHYLPNNTVVSIAGNLDQEHVEQIINQSLGSWEPGKILPRFPNADKQETPRQHIEHRNTEQAQICLGVPALSILHPDRFALDLISVVLGEGMSSRLFTQIREQQGLAYDIHSYVDHYLDSGALVVHAGVDPDRAEEALVAILNELSELKQGISHAELTRAKEMAKGRLLLGLENSRSVAAWLGAQEILTNQILSIDDITGMIEAVNSEDIRRVSQELLTTEKLNLAMVGPINQEEKLASILKL